MASSFDSRSGFGLCRYCDPSHYPKEGGLGSITGMCRVPSKGVYTLVIPVFETMNLRIGSLGVLSVQPGTYLYTGSALGKGSSGLNGRISRHLRASKKTHWHIDHLLRFSSVTELVFSEAERNLECVVQKGITASFDNAQVVRGFGSSDCRERCGGHLTWLDDLARKKVLFLLLQTYRSLGLLPKLISLPNPLYSP